MSTHRTRPDAGWICTTKEKGPNGRGLCRFCGTEVPKGCRTFCGEPCVHEWKIQTQPGYARALVAKRDKGVCCECGIDTVALLAEADRLRKPSWDLYRGSRYEEMQTKALPTRREFLESKGFPANAYGAGDVWQMDHQLEVVRGGGCCGLDNLVTRCTPCHKRKTKRLAAERAAERRAEKERAAQTLFSEANP